MEETSLDPLGAMQSAWALPAQWTARSRTGLSAQLWQAPSDTWHDLGCGLQDDYLILSLHVTGVDFAEVALSGRTRWAKGLPQASWMLVDTSGAPEAQVHGGFRLLHVYVPKSVLRALCDDYEVTLPAPRNALYRAGSFGDGALGRAALGLAQAATDQGPLRQMRIDSAAAALMGDLVSSLMDPPSRATRLSPTARTRLENTIIAKMDQPLRLDDLAQAAGLSKFHFARAVKADFGMSPMQLLRTRRLAAAQQLLATENTPITDIALRCGFADHSHLSSAFRDAFGTTPSRFRASLRRS
ncbi:MAG: helix-turn-helix transcriptional regulator [Pseudomonadota bacterium]